VLWLMPHNQEAIHNDGMWLTNKVKMFTMPLNINELDYKKNIHRQVKMNYNAVTKLVREILRLQREQIKYNCLIGRPL